MRKISPHRSPRDAWLIVLSLSTRCLRNHIPSFAWEIPSSTFKSETERNFSKSTTSTQTMRSWQTKNISQCWIFFPPFLQFLNAHSSTFSKDKVIMRSSRSIRWATSPVVQRRMLLEVQLYVPHFAFPHSRPFVNSFSPPPVRAASKLRGLHRLRRRRRSRPTTQGGKQKGGSRRSVSRQER